MKELWTLLLAILIGIFVTFCFMTDKAKASGGYQIFSEYYQGQTYIIVMSDNGIGICKK